MSYTVPYTFVPGTKAKAQEVNANFSAVLDSLGNLDESKANLDLSNISSAALDIIKNNSSVRNIGELVFSPIPLSDANLHLLDGSVINGDGIYADFVNYIGDKYRRSSDYNPDVYNFVGNVSVTSSGVATGFVRTSSYIYTEEFLDLSTADNWELVFEFNASTITGICYLLNGTISGNSNLQIFLRSNGKLSWGVFSDNGSTQIVKTDTENVFTINTEYTCKLCFVGNAYEFYYMDGAGEWILDSRVSNSNHIGTISKIYIGTGNNENFNGFINLKNFVLKRNNTEIFSGSQSPNYFTDEETWQSTVTRYGECGKFVYSSSSRTVRLPKIKGLLEYTTSAFETGSITEAGLPNIKGFIDKLCTYSTAAPTGAIYQTSSETWRKSGVDQTLYQKDVHFDASRSSNLYGKSSTVQPQTIKYLVYIVLAGTSKTDIQVDLDNVVSDLNLKLDKDLSNLSTTGCENFDGQWTYKSLAINSNAILTSGKYDIDLSSYLPSDRHKYEVIVSIYGSQSSSTTNSFVILSSGVITEAGSTVSYANLVINSKNTVCSAQTVFPVGVDKVLSYRIGGNDFDSIYIRLYGYRRIGTNI